MSEAQLERATTALYEDDGIRGDLTDDEAQILLGWGEARLTEMATYDLPDGQYDVWCAKLRQLLAAVNRFVAARDELMSGDEARMARELHGLVEQIGYNISPTALDDLFQEQISLDHQTAINKLLALFQLSVDETDGG
ncbi:MAG: hypothetical protein R3E39_16780 [Anaerolineae bacterium]